MAAEHEKELVQVEGKAKREFAAKEQQSEREKRALAKGLLRVAKGRDRDKARGGE